MLAVSLISTTYLGWRLGTGSEYKDVKVMAGEATNPDELDRRESVRDSEVRRVNSRD